MTEREKEILMTIAYALPMMSEFDKGYFLEVAESRASERRKADEEGLTKQAV